MTPVEVVNSGTLEWHLSVIDPGECKQEIAFNAAMRVQDELARLSWSVDEKGATPLVPSAGRDFGACVGAPRSLRWRRELRGCCRGPSSEQRAVARLCTS
jgi:hypothetical protein